MEMDDEKPVGWKWLCSLGEAAWLAGVSKRTICRRIRAGQVVAKKIGNQWAVDVRSLDVAAPEERLRTLRRGLAEVYWISHVGSDTSGSSTSSWPMNIVSMTENNVSTNSQ